MNRWKQIAMALVMAPVLSGGGLTAEEMPTQQGANESAPAADPSSSSTDVTCCPIPEDASGAKDFCVRGVESHGYKPGIFGYEITGNGSAWFRSETGEYCVEEGSSISFPDGKMVEGPKSVKH